MAMAAAPLALHEGSRDRCYAVGGSSPSSLPHGAAPNHRRAHALRLKPVRSCGSWLPPPSARQRSRPRWPWPVERHDLVLAKTSRSQGRDQLWSQGRDLSVSRLMPMAVSLHCILATPLSSNQVLSSFSLPTRKKYSDKQKNYSNAYTHLQLGLQI